MRTFTQRKGIGDLPVESRVLYSGFCLFLLAGYGSAFWFYHDDRLGATPEAAAIYYLGDEAAANVDSDPSSPAEPSPTALDAVDGGPVLALPAEAMAAPPLQIAKPARQVVETFHFHLFSVPIVLLIIAHLFLMCELSRRLKIGMLVLANLGTGAHLFAPPLVRFVSADLAFLVFPSAILMGVTWMAMTLWPLYDMWCRPLVLRWRKPAPTETSNPDSASQPSVARSH